MDNPGEAAPRQVSEAVLPDPKGSPKARHDRTADAAAAHQVLGDTRAWLALSTVLLATFVLAFLVARILLGLLGGSFPFQTDIIGYPSFHDYNNYAPLQAYYVGLTATVLASPVAFRRMRRWRDLAVLTPAALAGTAVVGVTIMALLNLPLTAAALVAFIAVLATRAVVSALKPTQPVRPPSTAAFEASALWRHLQTVTPITVAGAAVVGITIAAVMQVRIVAAVIAALAAMLALRIGLERYLDSPRDEQGRVRVLDHLTASVLLICLPWLLFVVSAVTGWIEPGRFVHLTWFPLPLAIAATVVAAIALHRHGRFSPRDGATATGLADRMLTWIVVPAIVYLVLIEVKGHFNTGHDLFHTGEFIGPLALAALGDKPWRDFLFVHGIWEDFLKFYPGKLLWEPSLRAAFAFPAVVTAPLYWLSVYLFFAVVTRGNLILSCLALMVTHGVMNGSEFRFPLYALILIALAQWCATTRLAWLGLFAALVTIQCILTPEFGVVAVGLGLLVSARGWVSSERLRVRMMPTLMGASIAVATFLASLALLWHLDVLDGFVISLLHFARGHLVTGGIPLALFDSLPLVACLILVVVIVGPALLWHEHQSRGTASVPALVTTAIALATALYGLKFFGRPDDPHLPHVLAVAAPALGIFAALATAKAGAALGTLTYRDRPLHPTIATATIAIVVFAAGVPSHATHAPSASWLNRFLTMPDNVRSVTRSELEGDRWAPGIETRGYRDRYAAVQTYLATRVATGEVVFDFSDSPVLAYGILGLKPASRILHVSMAIRPETQKLVVDDLARTRPRYVLYRSIGGLNGWDGIGSEVRHHLIAAAIHRAYVFEAEVGGVTIFIRRDLAVPESQRPPTPSALLACDLGYVPNALRSTAIGTDIEPVPFVPAQAGAISVREGDLAMLPRHPGTHGLRIEFSGDLAAGPAVVSITGSGSTTATITARLRRGADHLTLPVGGCLAWPDMKPPLRITINDPKRGVAIKSIHGIRAITDVTARRH